MSVRVNRRFGCLTDLYDYQVEGVRGIDAFGGRCLLADSMGLGKSVQAFAWGHWRLRDGQTTVIVCPATLKENWRREVKKHFGRVAVVLDGRTPDPARLNVPFRRPVYVINYDVLGGRSKDDTWAAALARTDLAYVIADEVHYCTSPSAQRTKALKSLVAEVPHFVALSGTPLVNQPTELWPALNMLDPDEFPSFVRFASRYSRPEFTPWGVKYKGSRRLKELHALLKDRYMIRRLKQDVLKQLPPKTRQLVPLVLPPAAHKEYVRAESDFVNWLRRTHPQKAERARKAERLVKYGYLKRLAGELKQPLVEDWCRGFMTGSGKKLILFTTHRGPCDRYTRAFAPGSVKVDGGVVGRDRQAAIDRFMTDPRCRLLVGNMKAAGVGWNGTVTDSVAFAEFAWTPGDHTQAEDRVHRIGQTDHCTAYWLFAPGTIEEHLIEVIQKKQLSLDGALDGLGAGEGEFNVLDLLEQSMLRG